MHSYYGNDSSDQPVMWDFRQFYVAWVQVYMKNFSMYHTSDDYPNMLKSLKKWHSVIYGRFISATKEYNPELFKDKTFDKIVERISLLANNEKYQTTYFLKTRNPEAVAKFDDAFEEGVKYIIWLMKKAKMFGTETVNRGL